MHLHNMKGGKRFVVSWRKENKRVQTTTGMVEKERSVESGNSEPRKRKNAARYWSIDTLLRRLRCLLESSRRKNTSENKDQEGYSWESKKFCKEIYRFVDIMITWLLEFHDFYWIA